MSEDKRKLYEALSPEYDLGTYEEFERNIGDSVKRRKLYDAASADYDLGDFESYSQRIGPTHKESLDAFTAEYGSWLTDFEARDSAETNMSKAGMSSGIYVPAEGAITGEERKRYMELHKQEEALKKAWFTSDEYLAQKDADALFLSDARKGLSNQMMEYAQANPVLRQEGPFQINPYATRGAEADTELEKYRTASRILDDAIKMHNAPSRYDDKNVFLKFGKGAGDVLSDVDFWTAGLTEIADNLGVRDVLSTVQEKLGNLNDLSEEAIENILSPAEKAVLQAWAINTQEQLKRKDDLSRAYQAGQGATESLGFMAEFALTGGIGKATAEGAETLAKWLGKKVLSSTDEIAGKVVKETAENTVGEIAKKYGKNLGLALAEAAGRTGVMPSTFRNISEKATEIKTDENGNNYLVGMNEAFAKGLADSFIENLSEGGRVNALGELIGDVAGKIPAYKKLIDKFSNSKVGELYTALQNSGIMNTLRAGGWHGIGEEYLEEWYGNALRTLTGVDKEALKEFATIDNQIITLTSFLPMTIFGGTVSTAQVLSANKDLAKKAEALRSALLERGYDEAQADNMIDMMRGSSPAELSQMLSPIVKAVADKSVNEAAALMEPVADFTYSIIRQQTFGVKYNYQQQEQRDALFNQMNEALGQFWQESEDGTRTVQRGSNSKGEIVYLLSKPSADEATEGIAVSIPAITAEGRKVFVNPSEYQLEDELQINDFLGSEIMAEKRNAEQARMIEEKEANRAKIAILAQPGTALNIGTEENPIEAIVIQQTADGVTVTTGDQQARLLTWEELGNVVNIALNPMTDSQIDEVESNAILAQQEQRSAELDEEYGNTDKANAEISEAGLDIETMIEATNPLPLKADGSVDQTTLWNTDPVRWAQWNDEQRQDGGANSIGYINNAILREQQAIVEMEAAYAAESDFETRDSIEQEIGKKRARLDQLTTLQNQYVAAQQAAAAPAVETAPAQEDTVAPRVSQQMSEEEKAQMDAQYENVLKQTRIREEKARLLQEYLFKLSEGSIPAIVLTADNYAEVMRENGCSEGVISVVTMHLENGENIGGFMSGGKIFLMADGLPSIEEARVTYVHERQHALNRTNRSLLQKVADILGSESAALEIIKTFVGSANINAYKNDTLLALADEVVARCMEIAYTTEDFSVDLQSRGVPSELISIITEINNEQRKDQSLLNSRRGSRRDSHADVSGAGSLSENGADIRQVSRGVLDNEEARPSGISEEGISPRSTGEGAEVISEEQLNAPHSGEPSQITASDGEVIADTNGKGGVRFSIRTWREGGRDYLAAWLNNDKTLTDEEKADILARMDEFYENAQKYTNVFAPFGTWSEADVRYDSNGNPLMSVIKANGDYAMNLDFSLVCKKRRPLNRLLRTLINRNAFGTYSLKEREIAEINWILQEHGFEVACALCFVDSKRYRVTGVADIFADLYNKMVTTLAPKGVAIAHFNYNNNPNVEVVENGIDTLPDEQLNWEAFEEYAAKFKEGSVESKVAQLLRENPSQRRLVDATDFIEAEGFEAVKANNQELLKLYNAKKGTGGPKASFGDVQYLNDILKKERNFNVEKAYAVGGVRIQSFSDFVPHMYFDYMQLFAELAAKKLPAHAYTKEVLFAKIFGLTGLKINLSLVPAVVEGGVAPGLDAEGNYAWADAVRDTEGNIIQQAQSFPFDEAMAIQNAEGYSKNCGAIAVGISDEHIEKMLDDPNIQFIIPYHKSSLNAIVARMTNIDQYKDYTNVQTTKKASGTKLDKGTKDFNFNEYLHNLGESGTPQQAAQAYLDWCKENNFRPKFSQFAYHPNYYKLLVDFNTIDTTTGEYTPQGAVTMTFPTEQNAFGNVETLIEQGLGEDAQLEEKMEAEIDQIVDEVESRLAEIAQEPELSKKQQLKRMAELADERAAQIKERAERPINVVEEARRINAMNENAEIAFRFIGEMGAIMIDHANEAHMMMDLLEVAREMEMDERGAREIKMATGWERGADGKWRYEEPDFTFKTKPGRKKTFKLSELIEDETLFEAYPEFKDIQVKFTKLAKGKNGEQKIVNGKSIINLSENLFRAPNPLFIDTLGAFQKNHPEIYNLIDSGRINEVTPEQWDIFNMEVGIVLNNQPEYIDEFGARETLAHEIQHAIQRVEGFARGGTASMIDTTDPQVREERNALKSALNVEIDHLNYLARKYHDTRDKAIERNNAGDKTEGMRLILESDKIAKEWVSQKALVSSIERDLKKLKRLGDEGYNKLAGEVEARNVMSRLNMSFDERRQSLYSDTQDVATEDQIFLRNNVMQNYSEMMSPSVSFRLAPRIEEQPEQQDEINAIRATAIVMGNFMKAPNGKATNLTEEQWLMVRTKNFLNWFGDWINDPENASKVVDENGEPMVMIHNTTKEGFYKFDPARSISPNGAMWFSNKEGQKHVGGFERGGRDIAAFLNIRKPNREGMDAARYALEEGFDGVIVEQEGAAVGVVYDPSQIKSADPVTYDNNGNAISLLERFNSESEDIRFRVTPEQDKAYMDAVEAGDMEKAQKMVDEAAKAAGYTIRGDHGRVSKFTVFDRNKANPEGNWGQGFYFTNNEEDVEENYANVEGPDLEEKIEREVERRVNLAEMNEDFNEDGEVDEFAIRDAVEKEFITSEPNVVHAAIKMDNPFVVGHGMVEIGEDGLGHYDMEETYLTAEYETDEDGEIDYDVEPTGTLVDLVEALNDELSEYEGVNIDAYEIFSNNLDGMTASQFEKEARELLNNKVDYLQNDDSAIMTSEIIRAAIERAGFDGIIDNTVNQKFGDARRFGQSMPGVNADTRHYIAFQSSQIKQTDPVTYDDAGNVIPLSERFNPENEDIRFRAAIAPAIQELNNEGISINNEALMKEYGLSDITLTKKGDYVTVSKVVVADKGKGNGTRFMNDLVMAADENGWILALTPDDSFGATSVARLKRFYKGFGFKENKGRNADFNTRESMIRTPKNEDISFSARTEEMKASVMEGQVMFRTIPITQEVQNEMDVISATAIVRGNYLKAPNGADTNLTPEQWAMVRTKAFKAWFGDWEKAARIQKLRNSEDASINGDEIAPTESLDKKAALEYGKKLQGFYTNKDTGASIQLQRGRKNGGVNEVLQHNYKDAEHLQSIAAIPQIIEKSIFIESTPNADIKKNPGVVEYQHFVCGLKIGGEDYTVHSLVAVDKKGDRYYDHNLTAIEKKKLLDLIESQAVEGEDFGTTPGTQPTILSTYKGKQLVSLLQVNASKVVDENGEPKVVYHQTNAVVYINRETGENWDELDWRAKQEWDERDDWEDYWEEQDFNTFSRVNARTTNEFDGFFFAPNYDEYHEYGDRTIPAFLNIKHPASREDYNIDSSKNDAGREERIRLQNEGFDGVIRMDGEEVDEYIAFSPNQIKSATDNTGEFSTEENDIRYRVVTDPAKIEELENGEKIKVYRAMQVIDGKLYPPMSAMVDGKLREPIELGQWEEAEERPDLADNKGYFKLNKGNKKSLKARYNPYFHTSYTPLNDQFSEAQNRPNLVTVEVEIPVSELTSGYKAEKAKDSVGEKEWKAGVIQGKLSGTRKVILSRWDKPVRIVPDSEVADVIVKMFEGKDITMPSNVVTPSLRAELEKRGVPFVDTDNRGNLVPQNGNEKRGASQSAMNLERNLAQTSETVGATSSTTNVPILSEEASEEVSFRIGTPTEEVVAEGVNLSKKDLANLAGDIFAALPEESRKKITDSLNGNLLGLQDAIFQIPTSLAIKENWNDEDKEMADVVAEQITKIVGKEMTRPFSASEALWILYNAVNKSTDLVSEASRALVRRNLGFDPQTQEQEQKAKEDVRFRTATDASLNATVNMYNKGSRSARTRLKESFVDMNASVEELVKAIEKSSGKKAQGFENILYALNQQSSKGLAAMETYEHKFLKPLFDAILEIMKSTNLKYSDVVRYVILKHGLERNKKLAQRDAMAHYQEIYDEIIAKIKSMTDAQKRTYLTNAQLQAADAKAELARLQAIDQSTLSAEDKQNLKKEIKKAAKAVAEAEEHLKKAKKIQSMSEQEALDELQKIFDKIKSGSDSYYQELRENDYSGLTSMFYDQLGVDRKDYETEEEYQEAVMEAKQDKYSTLADVEAAAEAEVADFENLTSTDELWKRTNAATKETLRQQYQANMISKDQYESLRDMFEFYVPLRGFADNTAEDMYTYYRKPNSTGYTKPILAAGGRKTEAESPFGWIAAMAGSAIASNVKNEAKLALYYFVSNRPDNGVATISKTWYVHTPGDIDARGKKIFRPTYPQFEKGLSSEDAKLQYEAWLEHMNELREQGQAYESGQRLNLGNTVVNIDDKNKPEHIVTVKVGGKDYTIIINGNPRAAQAINGDLNVETSADYQTIFGPILRWMSSVNTSYNPEFWATNMMRDMLFTFMSVNIKEDAAYRRRFMSNYGKAFKVIKMVYQNENGTIGDSYLENMYKEFVANGAVTGYTQIKDSEEWEKEIENYMKSNNTDEKLMGNVGKKTMQAFHKIHQFGESLEQVSRFAAFLTAREMGKPISEAVNDAKEITVNFNRKGSGKRITREEARYLTNDKGQPLNWFQQLLVSGLSCMSPVGRRFFMFFNASIQGLNATYKLWKANKTRSIGWALGYATVGMMNALIHALMDDDDDYLDMPQYERRNSLMIGGNGVYFKWALPQEARAFYALGDLAVESVMGRNPHQNAAVEAAKIMTEVLPVNPSEGFTAFVPSVLLPGVEILMNEDYKGDPIYNEQKWLTKEEERRTARWSNAFQGTGKMYIWTAQALNYITGGDEYDAGLINIHPEQIEHIVQSAFGGTIRTADKFITSVMDAINPDEQVTMRQMPFLNRFVTVNDERFRNVHVNDVYDHYAAEAQHAKALEKSYKKSKDKDSLKALRQTDAYRSIRIYEKYKKPIQNYQEKLRAADTSAEKMELMKQQDELKKRMIKEISEL